MRQARSTRFVAVYRPLAFAPQAFRRRVRLLWRRGWQSRPLSPNNSFKPTQLRGGNVLRLGRSYFAAAKPVGLTQALDVRTKFIAILVLVIPIAGIAAKAFPDALASPPNSFCLGGLLTLLALLAGYVGSVKLPAFRPVSRLRTLLGFAFFWSLPAVVEAFALRAISKGKIVLGARGGLPDHYYSLSDQPIGFWLTFVVYMLFVAIFSAVAFRHLTDSYERLRAHV